MLLCRKLLDTVELFPTFFAASIKKNSKRKKVCSEWPCSCLHRPCRAQSENEHPSLKKRLIDLRIEVKDV